MPKKVPIGTIIEIETSKGLSYAQYILKHEKYDGLIRVIDGFYETRPASFDSVVKGEDQFLAFMLLEKTVRLGIFEAVAVVDVPKKYQVFPLFKAPTWWLWDGKNEKYIGKKLPKKYENLPFEEIINPSMLKYRVRIGWLPKYDPSVIGLEEYRKRFGTDNDE